MKLDSSIAAIVTGGASGLGEATARMLSREGVKVALFDMNRERGEGVAREIGAVFCEANVADEQSVDRALGEARSAHGTARILVNCAGIAPARRTVSKNRETGAFVAHDVATFRRTIEVNLIGTYQMSAKCAAAMAELEPVTPDGGRGVIVSTASVAATDGQIGQAAYAASKGGVASLTLPAARELAGSGVRVVAIAPGLFGTSMLLGMAEQVQDSLAQTVPFPRRFGRPEEFAALVRHVVENPRLNGCVLRLDGALRMAPR